MKNKTKLSLVLSSLVLSTSLHAGLVGFNFGVGGGVYNTDAPVGQYSDGTTSVDLVKELGLEGTSNSYGWAYVEHPIPIIPNLRVEMNQDSYSGEIVLNKTFFNQTFSNNVSSTLDLSSTDIILYWGVPFTGMLSSLTPLIDYDIDFGVGTKNFNSGLSVNDEIGGVSVSENISDILEYGLPFGYLRLRAEAFDIGVEAQLKAIGYGDYSYSEFVAKVDYNLPLPLPMLDLGVEAGIKQSKIEADGNFDLETSGVFVGAFLKF